MKNALKKKLDAVFAGTYKGNRCLAKETIGRYDLWVNLDNTFKALLIEEVYASYAEHASDIDMCYSVIRKKGKHYIVGRPLTRDEAEIRHGKFIIDEQAYGIGYCERSPRQGERLDEIFSLSET